MSERAFENEGEDKRETPAPKTKTGHPTLDLFGRNLNSLAKQGKLDPVVGREKEIENIERILNKRKKNNTLIIGDPGVGKTCLAEGLAIKISKKETDRTLWNKTIIDLDMALVVSGTKYRGQFEERMKAIIQEIKNNPDVIVFIDEIHTVIGAGGASGGLDASNMLKPALARGELRCIGATTRADFKKYLESDEAFNRRFQKVWIYPPSKTEMYTILSNIKSQYEDFHNVTYSDDSLLSIIDLCDRYIPYRNFPDKAIDVMDEAGSLTKMKGVEEPAEFKKLETELKKVIEKKMSFAAQQRYEDAAKMRDEERNMQSQLEVHYKKWEEERAKNKVMVKDENVAAVISKHSGVPIASITQSEMEKIRGMEDHLNAHVIGQQHVVKKVTQAFKRNKMGIHDPNKPFTMLFLGGTGTGKTFLTKSIAKLLFDLDSAFIRLNMSEYMEKFNVSRLIGSPPGYVGHEDKGLLTEAVKNNPYSLILLDEVEKAHPDVMKLFLQVFDDGVLTDSHGTDINFKNTVIVMTSNIGTSSLMNEDVGFDIGGDVTTDTEEKVFKELKKLFPPELINRFDEKLVFRTLDREDMEKVVALELDVLCERLAGKGMELTYKKSLIDYLIDNGFDEMYGARPLKRLIVSVVENEVAQKMIDGKIGGKSTLVVGYDVKKGQLTLDVKNKK